MYRDACVFCLLTVGLVVPWLGLAIQGQQCIGHADGCGCTLDNGDVINIASLARTDGRPRFTDVRGDDFYLYSYNPCKPFTEGQCSNAAVCQVMPDKLAQYQAGDGNSAKRSFDGSNAVVYYSSYTDVFRESYVTYICDRSKSEPVFGAIGELHSPAQYYFEVTTKCACPNACRRSSGDD